VRDSTRTVLAALIRHHGWPVVRELVEGLRPLPGEVDRPAASVAEDATRIAKPTDLDRARAKRALRRAR
jgi:hypothetical protein